MVKTGRNTWKVLLIPFAWLYGLVVWIRNKLYDHGFLTGSAFRIPLISVGNITAGGTGKTPHVEYMAGLLEKELRVATLSRGYRRRTRDFRIVSASSTLSEVGDEALQVKRRFPGITVAVDRKRVNGVARLMELSPPLEVILLDDAYQHRAIRPGLSILLIDYNRPPDRDLLLPAGMLREPASNITRSNIILVTKTPESLQAIELREYANKFRLSMGQHLYFTTMRYGELRAVYPGAPDRNTAWFEEREAGILLLTGIANPLPLREYAESLSEKITELRFPDHHRYTRRDLENISGACQRMKMENEVVLVLTTEKDAVRLQEHAPTDDLRDSLYAIPIRVHFLNDDKDEFDRQIWSYVNSNKRSSILYKGENS